MTSWLRIEAHRWCSWSPLHSRSVWGVVSSSDATPWS